MNLTTLTAHQILSITTPEKLFLVSNMDELKKTYRKLSMLWHPDRKGEQATGVFMHIKMLYEHAQEKMNNGVWLKDNILSLRSENGIHYEFKFLKQSSFNAGEQFISRKYVLYQFDKHQEDIATRAKFNIKHFQFASSRMKEEMSKYLPQLKHEMKVAEKTILILEKPEETLSLRDVLNFYHGQIEPRHVAWILSTLYNLACYLEYSKLMCADISLDNYFISPKEHTGCLIGGWGFAYKSGEKITALTKDSLNLASASILDNKRAHEGLNLEMIRLIGRSLLGDPAGVSLLRNKDIPKDLSMWLLTAAGKSAVEEYKIWQQKILPASFGVRRYAEMPVKVSDIYPTI